jgi:hypothetical protein
LAQFGAAVVVAHDVQRGGAHARGHRFDERAEPLICRRLAGLGEVTGEQQGRWPQFGPLDRG